MDPTPEAPWRMSGECVLAWVRRPRALRHLVPDGLSTLPGPAALAAVRYADSPVGPYLELSVAVPARMGLRPGLCVVAQVVSHPGARLGYRRNWGLPAEVGALEWHEDGEMRVMRCKEPGIEVRGMPAGPSLPAIVPVRSVHWRPEGPVLLPRRFMCLMRLARVEVAVKAEADASLISLAGSHPGSVMSGVRIVAYPARRPVGLWSSLRAPLPAGEPALVGADGAATTVATRTGA